MGFKEWLTGTGSRRAAPTGAAAPSGAPPPPPPVSPGDVVLLDGSQIIAAVGESHYQDALASLCGGRTVDGHFVDVVAVLVPEPQNSHDPNAVAVMVGGRLVGYLSRDLAATCHAAIALRVQREGRPVGCRGQIRGGWDRGRGDVGSFGIELYFAPNRIDSLPTEPVSLAPAATAAVEAARERVGRCSPPGSAPDGKYNGRHFTEYIEQMKVLKREGPLDDLIALLCRLIDATEDESAHSGWGVAPAYFEELAVAYRKRKDYAAEVAILERFAALPHAPGATPPKLMDRLEKARRLLNEHTG